MPSTGSAVFTDRRYIVHPAARVRQEAFGLLFYDTKNSRLTFVKSGDRLRVLADPRGPKHVVASREAASREKIKKLLDYLQGKGLIGEI